MSPNVEKRPVVIRALLIPADLDRECRILDLPLTAAALSDAIGGGLLDDAVSGVIDSARYCVYLDADRRSGHAQENPRAVRVAARLGWERLAEQIQLRGDILITGLDARGNDADLPLALAELAHHSGLLACSCVHA